MINWQSRTIQEPSKMGRDTGLIRIHLPKTGGLSELEVIATAINGSASNIGNPLTGCISKVSITDGLSRYLYSLSAAEIQKMITISDKHAPETTEPTTVSATQRIRLPIRMGRYRADDLYALDLGRMSEPLLQIEHDLEVVRPTGNDGYISGSLAFEIDAVTCPEEDARRIPEYVTTIPEGLGLTAANSDYRKDGIDVEKNIAMTIYAYKSGVDDGDTFTKVEVFNSTNNHTLLEGSWADLQRMHPQYDGSVIDYAVHIPMGPRGGDNKKFTRSMPGKIDLKARMLTAGISPVIIWESIRPN